MPNTEAVRELISTFLRNGGKKAFLIACANDPRPQGVSRHMWFDLLLSSEEGIDQVAMGSARYVIRWMAENGRSEESPHDVLKLWWNLQHGKTAPFPLELT